MLDFRKAARLISQFVTDDGIPDLILEYEKFVIVMEAKTGTDEHPTPSSHQLQTVSYPVAVRRKRGLRPDVAVYMVFITPECRRAANPEAINTSYAELAGALLSKLDRNVLPVELQYLFGLIFTHFMSSAVPDVVDVKEVIENLEVLEMEFEKDAVSSDSLRRILTAKKLLLCRGTI
jgi:hypothetical protein